MPDVPYDPTANAAPFVASTATVKCYANYPSYLTRPGVGHRWSQFLGRDIQVTADNQATDPMVGSSFIRMLKHPQ
jgi:hypothetical protein